MARAPLKPPPKAARPSQCKSSSKWCLGPGTKATTLGALVLSIIAAFLLYGLQEEHKQWLPASLHAFPGPRLATLPQFQGEHANRLLWGTYRPGYYLGLRARTPKSLLFGMMWVDPQREEALDVVRHEAQLRDGLQKYGWLEHDGESYGYQELIDSQYNITTSWVKPLDTPEANTGSAIGRDWAVRVSADQLQQQTPRRNDDNQDDDEYLDEDEDEKVLPKEHISLFFYVATEDGSPVYINVPALQAALTQQQQQQPPPPKNKKNAQAALVLSGEASQPIGKWSLYMRNTNTVAIDKSTASSPPISSPMVVSYVGIRSPHFHNLTSAVKEELLRSLIDQYNSGKREDMSLTLPNDAERGANVGVLQITAQLPVSLDLTFLSSIEESAPITNGDQVDNNNSNNNNNNKQVSALSGDALTEQLSKARIAFNSRFVSTFGTLDEDGTATDVPAGTAAAARAALSNMLGGMGYWHGNSLVRLPSGSSTNTRKKVAANRNYNNNNDQKNIVPLWPASLFSATPSRSFFPRGFLWDEGFHQLLVQRWNRALSRDCLAHWLDLMTESGWIPREQILGEEARARVPAEFIPQSPDAANPPTLFLPLANMASRIAAATAANKTGSADSEEIEADAAFLRAAWPRLSTWFQWYNSTQSGTLPGSYRWRGRDPEASRELNPKTLTSGLDDYPRASHPTDEERHVDLRCWLALASRLLATVGAAAGAPSSEVASFAATADRLSDYAELKALHWDKQRKIFADWGLHTEDVRLVNPKPFTNRNNNNRNNNNNGQDNEPTRQVVGARPQPQFVPHCGYISLFPLFMGLIPPNSPELGDVLTQLRDPGHLWTPSGLRSLSTRSSMYQRRNTVHDPPYWRGPVWINMNYVALRALTEYSKAEGPHAESAGKAAKDLRAALLRNIVGQYMQRGYLYEQYDETTGMGQGSHPFTGWTALLTLIADEKSSSSSGGGSFLAASLNS